MFCPIKIGVYALAQGAFVRSIGDGQIEIDMGGRRLIGPPVNEPQIPASPAFSATPGAFRSALEGRTAGCAYRRRDGRWRDRAHPRAGQGRDPQRVL